MSVTPKINLVLATPEDAEAIASLRNAISDDLTFKHGKGPWTVHATTAAVLRDLREAKLYVALRRDEVILSLALTSQPPWLSAPEGLTPRLKPSYLTGLAVAPEFQRRGYGRAGVEQAIKLAKRAKSGALLAATFEPTKSGAGKFFERCGFAAIGRVTERGHPLHCFEKNLIA